MDAVILKSFLPEFFLSFAIILQLIYNIKIVNTPKYNFPIIDKEVFYQTLFILVSLLIIYSNLKIEGFFSNLLFTNDESTRIIKIVMLLTSIFILNIILKTFSIQQLNFFEYFIIFLLSVFSLLLLISSTDLITFYLVIEMQSLCFYILASFKRDSSFSSEAGLKYFIAGAFISGIFLFGASLLYGCLGTLNFNALQLLLAFPLESFDSLSSDLYTQYYYMPLVYIGILCVVCTLLFKLACVPFHFWAADVYEGSPLSSTIIFSVLPKISLVYFFIKWIIAVNLVGLYLTEILLFCGFLSVTVGTFLALSQKKLKKLIIYSSIAQIGFIVMGLALRSLESYAAVLFFLGIYIITSILIWSHFALFYDFQNKLNKFNKTKSTSLYISSLTNFFRVNKTWTFSFLIIFFSIGGIPPLTGFLSKILIIFELVHNHQIIYATLSVIISSISVYYYIRLVKIMFFEPKKLENSYEKFQVIFYDPFLDNLNIIFAFLLFLLVVVFFFPTMPMLMCHYIVLNIFSYI